MNIVVLISGNGSNLQAIIDACKTNKIKGTVRAVFSNKADAFGLERARQAGIATHTLITSAFDSREAYDRELIHEIDMYAPDVVVLAGFMRILSPAIGNGLHGSDTSRKISEYLKGNASHPKSQAARK